MHITDQEKATVFIVDDHSLVREWFANFINHQPDLRSCGGAADAFEAIGLITALKPQVVIVDISLEGGSGLELIKNIKVAATEAAIVVLSMHDESLYAERAIRAGARGYVTKREATKNVLNAIRCVLDGKPFFSEKTTMMMVEKAIEGRFAETGSQVELLSNRELEVFQLLGCGRSSRQIAQEMQISFRTVQSFCARVKLKLGLNDATALLLEAVRWQDRQHSR
jgi:DNA-binding NarL/FixJ family response regulator